MSGKNNKLIRKYLKKRQFEGKNKKGLGETMKKVFSRSTEDQKTKYRKEMLGIKIIRAGR